MLVLVQTVHCISVVKQCHVTNY